MGREWIIGRADMRVIGKRMEDGGIGVSEFQSLRV
jgi:hypothetical protein